MNRNRVIRIVSNMLQEGDKQKMEEWKRVFHKKTIILILVAMLANLILFTYGQLSGRNLTDFRFANQEYQKLVKQYENTELTEAFEQSSQDLLTIGKFNKGRELGEINDGSQQMLAYYTAMEPTQQTQLQLDLKHVKSKLEYLSSYQSSVNNVIANADNLKKYSLFSKQDSFSYNNILRTAADFERVENTAVKLDNDRGVDAFVHYYYLYYIAAAIMVLIIYSLFQERENGIWKLVHNTANGRIPLALTRLGIIIGGSFVVLAVLYGSTFLMSMFLYGGWADLKNPIQTLSDFNKFTYSLSKWNYVCRLYLVAWFALAGMGTILWMLFTVFRNRNHTLVFVGCFVGVEILLYQKIEMQSVYNALRYINIVSILKINEVLSSYLNWGFTTYVFSVLSILLFALGCIAFLSAVIAIMSYADMRPETRTSRVAKLFTLLHMQYQKAFSKYPVVIKELHKFVVTGKGIWVVVCVILISIYFSTTGKMTFTDQQMEMDQMYLEHGGADYSYIKEYVSNLMEEYQKAQQQMEETQARYDAGEIEQSQYIQAVGAVQYQAGVISRLREYQEKINYMQELKDSNGIKGWLISDRGYEEIFGQYAKQRELILILILVTGVMFVISESISMEYRTGMAYIIKSCPNGRKWVTIRKVAASVLFTVGLMSVVYCIDYWNLSRIYGLPYLQAPVMSLGFMKEYVSSGIFSVGLLHTRIINMSILDWIICRMVMRLLVVMVTMTIALVISKVIGKKGSRAVMPLVLTVIIFVVLLLYKGGML